MNNLKKRLIQLHQNMIQENFIMEKLKIYLMLLLIYKNILKIIIDYLIINKRLQIKYKNLQMKKYEIDFYI